LDQSGVPGPHIGSLDTQNLLHIERGAGSLTGRLLLDPPGTPPLQAHLRCPSCWNCLHRRCCRCRCVQQRRVASSRPSARCAVRASSCAPAATPTSSSPRTLQLTTASRPSVSMCGASGAAAAAALPRPGSSARCPHQQALIYECPDGRARLSHRQALIYERPDGRAGSSRPWAPTRDLPDGSTRASSRWIPIHELLDGRAHSSQWCTGTHDVQKQQRTPAWTVSTDAA